MTHRRSAVAIGLVAAALALAGCGGDGDDSAATDTETTTTASEPGTTLSASVGPGFEISLASAGAYGAGVTTLPAGTYSIEVDDRSDIHNFHLTGPGVDEATEVGATGADTWEVTLEAGTYEFVCDPHASTMSGSFEVSG